MVRLVRGLVAALVVVCLASGCAGLGRDLGQMENALIAGDPGAALERLEPMAGSRLNETLYALHRGMLLRHKGDFEGSVAAFERAKALAGALEPISLSETLATWTVTETADSYQPPLHEHLLLHGFQMLNYLQLGQLDAARVEAVQVDLGLRRIDPARGQAPDGADAFARHLSGLVYEAGREWSDALIAYRHAHDAYQRQGIAIPRDLQLSLVRLADHVGLTEERDRYSAAFDITRWEPMQRNAERAMVVVVVQDGLGPLLEEQSVVVPVRSDQFVRISLPALRARPTGLGGARISVDGESGVLDPSAQVAVTAQRWLERQMPALTARSIARNVVRYGATERASQESPLLGLAVNLAGLFLEQADTRIWRTLPDRIHVGRLDVPPETGELRIDFLGSDGRSLQSERRRLDLAPGRMHVVSGFWLGDGR